MTGRIWRISIIELFLNVDLNILHVDTFAGHYVYDQKLP